MPAGVCCAIPAQIDAILGALRPVIRCGFTVKTRVGFDSPEEFPRLLEVFARHDFDALTVHGRTVREMYRTAVHLDRIRDAVQVIAKPVFANGNVLSVRLARVTTEATGAAGLMIGRGAIRNPWIFRQLREEAAGQPVFQPTLRDVREYIEDLFHAVRRADGTELGHVAKMKKYLNFIGQGIGEEENVPAGNPARRHTRGILGLLRSSSAQRQPIRRRAAAARAPRRAQRAHGGERRLIDFLRLVRRDAHGRESGRAASDPLRRAGSSAFHSGRSAKEGSRPAQPPRPARCAGPTDSPSQQAAARNVMKGIKQLELSDARHAPELQAMRSRSSRQRAG